MKHFVNLLIWTLILSCCPMEAQQLGAAQVSKPQPADIPISHDVLAENARLRYIFLDMLAGTGLHGGFVELEGCSDLPKGRLQINKGATVRQAMDAFVAANPGYQWELKDGVVNLMPRGGAPLLDTRIVKFEKDETDLTIQAILLDLARLPEVRERVAALGLKGGTYAGPGGGGAGVAIHPVPRKPVVVHVNVQDLSLREAFNKIAQGAPQGIWVYHETDCNGDKTFLVDWHQTSN